MTRKRRPRTERPSDRDLRPDGWSRFEKAVDVALHTKPKHRAAAKPTPKRQQAEHRP